MNTGDKATRLRIYISSTDKSGHTPLYELIVYSARKNGLAGATVFRGIMGYGASSEIHSNKVWEITEKMPLVIEIIDEPAKVQAFYLSVSPLFDASGKGHMVTSEEITVMRHKAGLKKP
jgi:PII-like signaling protein